MYGIRRIRYEAPPTDVMNVTDISGQNNRYIDKTKRSVNALDPEYCIYGETIRNDPKHSKPTKAKAYISDSHLLQTNDIDGASPGWNRSGVERREVKNTNYLNDIDGAHADSIRAGIVTDRCVHPLEPWYTSLDGEILSPTTVGLLPKDVFHSPKLIASSPIKPPLHGNASPLRLSASTSLISPIKTNMLNTNRINQINTDTLTLAISEVKCSPQITSRSGGSTGRNMMSPGRRSQESLLADIASVRALKS